MGHKRCAPKQRGCRDDPVGWVSRECISELTSTLDNVVREGFDAIFREQPHLGDPFRRANLETQAAAALECGDFEHGNAGKQKLVPFAMPRKGLTRLARELLGVSIDPTLAGTEPSTHVAPSRGAIEAGAAHLRSNSPSKGVTTQVTRA